MPWQAAERAGSGLGAGLNPTPVLPLVPQKRVSLCDPRAHSTPNPGIFNPSKMLVLEQGVVTLTLPWEITFSPTCLVLLVLWRKEKRMRNALAGVIEILWVMVWVSISHRVWRWGCRDASSALKHPARTVLLHVHVCVCAGYCASGSALLHRWEKLRQSIKRQQPPGWGLLSNFRNLTVLGFFVSAVI